MIKRVKYTTESIWVILIYLKYNDRVCRGVIEMKDRRIVKYIALWVMVTMLCLLLGVGALAESTSVADRQTIDDWQGMFGSESEPTTQYAGAIWVDKSVFTASEAKAYFGNDMTIGNDQFGNENFLVSLSAIGSNSEVVGYSTIPTDTMIVLDLSSSMYPDLNPKTIDDMVNAVNETIVKLQNLNANNRVGVTTYFGGHGVQNSLSTPQDSHLLMLPLGRYEKADGKFLVTTKNDNNTQIRSVKVNSNVKIEGTNTNVAQAQRHVVWTSGDSINFASPAPTCRWAFSLRWMSSWTPTRRLSRAFRRVRTGCRS